MKTLIVLSWLVFVSGCASIHSPRDLRDWCVAMGSTNLASVGPDAFNSATCEKEFKEDVADQTPRILYIPRDLIATPIIAARFVWQFLGRTQPPF